MTDLPRSLPSCAPVHCELQRAECQRISVLACRGPHRAGSCAGENERRSIMHSALFVAGIPDINHYQGWTGFLGAIMPKFRSKENAKRLSENVWLVNFHKSPSALSWLVTSAERHGIPFGILPFDEEPQWLPVGF